MVRVRSWGGANAVRAVRKPATPPPARSIPVRRYLRSRLSLIVFSSASHDRRAGVALKGHCDTAGSRHLSGLFLALTRIPCRNLVVASRYAGDLEFAGTVWACEIWVLEHQDVGLHFRVNVAEDADVARLVKRMLAHASLVKSAQVEFVRANAEDVVGQVVTVAKLYRRAFHHWQHIRNEDLLYLVHRGGLAGKGSLHR